jgi:hypothetical protein
MTAEVTHRDGAVEEKLDELPGDVIGVGAGRTLDSTHAEGDRDAEQSKAAAEPSPPPKEFKEGGYGW